MGFCDNLSSSVYYDHSNNPELSCYPLRPGRDGHFRTNLVKIGHPLACKRLLD